MSGEQQNATTATTTTTTTSNSSATTTATGDFGALGATSVADKKCCGGRCFQRLWSQLGSLSDKPFSQKVTPSNLATLMTTREMFTSAAKKNRAHTYTVYFAHGPMNVCRGFFCHAYNIKLSTLKSAVRLMNSTSGGGNNAAARLALNGEQRPDVDETPMVLRAQQEGVPMFSFSLSAHVLSTAAIAQLRCDEVRRNNRKLSDPILSTVRKLFASDSAYAALFYNGSPYAWRHVLEGARDENEKRREKLVVVVVDNSRNEHGRAQAAVVLSALVRAHAVLDPYRGVDEFSRLPTPFTVQALALMSFVNTEPASLNSVRALCASLRVLPYMPPRAFLNAMHMMELERECSLCALKISRHKEWRFGNNNEAPCEFKFHRVFNFAASYAQERFIESMALCSSYALLRGAPPDSHAKSDQWSVEMGTCSVLVPQERSVWQQRTLADDSGGGGVVSMSEHVQHGDNVVPRYALPFVLAAGTEHFSVYFIEDAQDGYAHQLLMAMYMALFKVFKSLLDYFNFSYEQDCADQCSVRHHTLVVRCTPLLDIGGEMQRLAGDLMRTLCATLARGLTSITYIVDLQWHWLPLEHNSVWFPPEQVGAALDTRTNALCNPNKVNKPQNIIYPPWPS